MALKINGTALKKCNVNNVVCKHINVNSVNVWNAECRLFPVSDTEDTYTSWLGGGASTTSEYIAISLSTSETKYNYCNTPVDLTGYDKINFNIDEVSASEGFWCNIGVSKTITTAPERSAAIESGKAGTYSVNISDLNGSHYMILRGKRGKYDGKAFYIKNIWLS